MTFKTSSALICALTLIVTLFLVRSRFTVVPADQTNLIIGTVGNYAPFASVNAQGDYEGFDIDVAKALANRLGKKLVIKDLGSMAPLFMALEQESIEAIIWGLSITKARLQKVAMIRYQGDDVTAYPLIFWQQIPTGITSLNDMQGMTVCVEPASAQQGVLNAYSDIQQLTTERVDDALLNIQYGKAAAALVEPAIALKFKNKYPEIQLLDVPLSAENQVLGTGIAIKKTNTKLQQDVERVIYELIADGTITTLEKKWGI